MENSTEKAAISIENRSTLPIDVCKLVVCHEIVPYNASFTTFNIDFIVLNKRFIIFNTNFIVFNTKFSVVYLTDSAAHQR